MRLGDFLFIKPSQILFPFFLLMSVCSCTNSASHLIKIDGSSTVYPISEAIAEEYLVRYKLADKNETKSKVTVGVSGTGGGFKKFCRGDIDISGASRPISQKEIDSCKKANIEYYEIPVAYDAAVIVVNKKNPINQITLAELKKIWSPDSQGKVSLWKDVNSSWSSFSLKLFGAGSDSGTFDYFTEAVVGKAKSSRSDYTASEDDNIIVKGVSMDEGALGYLPYAYYQENKDELKALAVSNIQGEYVVPSETTVENASYNPLSRPLFIYVNAKNYQRKEVKEFIEFYLKSARVIVTEVKSIPFPQTAYEKIQKQVNSGKVGTVFGGHAKIGLSIHELIEKDITP